MKVFDTTYQGGRRENLTRQSKNEYFWYMVHLSWNKAFVFCLRWNFEHILSLQSNIRWIWPIFDIFRVLADNFKSRPLRFWLNLVLFQCICEWNSTLRLILKHKWFKACRSSPAMVLKGTIWTKMPKRSTKSNETRPQFARIGLRGKDKISFLSHFLESFLPTLIFFHSNHWNWALNWFWTKKWLQNNINLLIGSNRLTGSPPIPSPTRDRWSH